MRFKTLTLLSAISIAAIPTMAAAQSQPVAPAVTAKAERASAEVQDANNLGGGSDTLIAVLAGAIAIAFVTLTIVNNDDDDDDDDPVSP